MASSSTTTNDNIAFDIPQVIRVYKDGKVERFWGTLHVDPSDEDPTTGVSSKDITISPQVSARLYLPNIINSPESSKFLLPIFVYYHAGAFCLGSAFGKEHHRYLNTLASQANCLAVSVEYRLAPEHLLPAAFDDSWTALQWVASHAIEDLIEGEEKEPWLIKHCDFSRLFIGGDSAGGTIVHNLSLKAGTEHLHGGVKIFGAILSFPYFWGSKPIKTESVETYEKSISKKWWDFVYPTAPGGVDCPLFNPFVDGAPSFDGLACSKILVCTGEKDEFRGRGIYYVEFVKKSGWNGEIELVDVEGEGHCFHIYEIDSNTNGKAKDLISRIVHFVRK